SFVPVTISAVAGVKPQEQGLASGLVNTSRQVGGSIGLAILATVATARTHALRAGPAAAVAGFHRAFQLDAGFAGLGPVAVARPRKTAENERTCMILLGVVLVLLGIVTGAGILYSVGAILLVAGVILYILGATNRAVGPRRHYW